MFGIGAWCIDSVIAMNEVIKKALDAGFKITVEVVKHESGYAMVYSTVDCLGKGERYSRAIGIDQERDFFGEAFLKALVADLEFRLKCSPSV